MQDQHTITGRRPFKLDAPFTLREFIGHIAAALLIELAKLFLQVWL